MAALLQPAAACRPPTPSRPAPGAASRAHQQQLPAQQRQCRQQQRRRRVRAAAAGAGGGGLAGGDSEPVDIDALAARLGQEAERLRQEGGLDEGEAEDSDEQMAAAPSPASSAASRSGQPGLLAPFGYEKTGAADILAAVGDGGFIPDEFELLQELGTINIQQARRLGGRASRRAPRLARSLPPRGRRLAGSRTLTPSGCHTCSLAH